MLCVLQVDIHEDGHYHGYDNDQHVWIVCYRRQPSYAGSLVDYSDFSGAFRILPYDDEVRDDLGRHIVHHKCEQGLVRIPFSSAESRDEGPECACSKGCDA